MYKASMSYLRKGLCIQCQKEMVEKTYAKQPELMKIKLAELNKYIG